MLQQPLFEGILKKRRRRRRDPLALDAVIERYLGVNPGEPAECRRRLNKLATYLNTRFEGMSTEDFARLLEVQKEKCAICGKSALDLRNDGVSHGRSLLHVDHDEGTGEVRGILCANCNHAIGKLGHDPGATHASGELSGALAKQATCKSVSFHQTCFKVPPHYTEDQISWLQSSVNQGRRRKDIEDSEGLPRGSIRRLIKSGRLIDPRPLRAGTGEEPEIMLLKFS